MQDKLRDQPVPYRIWGRELIDDESIQQMERAALLPVSVAGALMPDAHVGYGLPIGGVLATRDAVIPYAVGVDIACRMRMSIFPQRPDIIRQQHERFRNALVRETLFGAGQAWNAADRADHDVLYDPVWQSTPLMRSLQDKGRGQLGTSGSGNHFVEWGALSLSLDDADLGLGAGDYLALLSHSGSRGVGYQIADHFSKLAMRLHPDLDKSVRHLAWLSLSSEAGQEYWAAMQLAGRFAAANHEIIHHRVASAVGLKPASTVENHHNFAWQETMVDPDTGQIVDVIVHRKGATPAGQGVFGIIPGSMGDAGYIVRGRGNQASLNSAAHGAGRVMSRRQAQQSITRTERDRYLSARGVTLIGGDLDESPQAYKPIDVVIAAQADLVQTVAQFTPLMVRMDGRI